MELGKQKIATYAETSPIIKRSKGSMVEIFALLIVIGLFYWFIVQPKKGALDIQKVKLAELQSEDKTLANSVTKLQELIKSIKEHPNEIAKLDEALPLYSKTFRMNMLMEELAKPTGVMVGGVSFPDSGDKVLAGNKELLAGPFGAKRTLQKLQGTIMVTGSYDQLQAFIKNIENNGRVMDISTMELSGVGEGKLSLKLSLATYYYE